MSDFDKIAELERLRVAALEPGTASERWTARADLYRASVKLLPSLVKDAHDLAALRAKVEALLTKPATAEGLDPEATRLVEGALRQVQDYLRSALKETT